MTDPNLLIFGFGYSGRAIAQAAAQAGIAVAITSRTPSARPPEPGVTVVPFAQADSAIAAATHLVTTAAPDENADPVLARYAAAIAAAPNLEYLGYLSTTGVYGNRDGGWVDENSAPAPQSPRTVRRVQAEQDWSRFASFELGRAKAVDIFRLAGIYGPGRSLFDDLRAGAARRVLKENHLFGRIHRDDIARGVLQALQGPRRPGVRMFNFSDDEPAASADVVVEAAKLLGVAPPAPVPFEQAVQTMSPMARSFWAENRRVANGKTKAMLNLTWLYPTYREGLRAILAEERRHRLA